MINNFTKKGIVQKIIVILIFLTIFNFMYPYMPVFAATTIIEQDEKIPGGVLLTPILNLITSLCEGVIAICQKYLLGMGASSIHVTSDEISLLGSFFTGGGIGAGAAIIIGLVSGPVGWAAIGGSALGGAIGGFVVAASVNSTVPDDYFLPLYEISPQEIFSDQLPALHINFINPTTYDDEGLVDSDGNPITDGENNQITINSAKELAPIISKWYVAIRNLVLVGLMVVLLYIGIRIVISSTSTEKAKYKENIKDWFIAVIIVVFMHYIMAFALNITGYITEMLKSQNYRGVVYQIPDFDLSRVKDENAKQMLSNTMDENGTLIFPTNLMGWARIQTQLESRDENGNEIQTWEKAGYVIIYGVLTVYTIMFLIIYLKRVVYMAFLTLIAPLVALTYPIDKLGDGQAQAFNMWLKEYIFNLLLQPFHLLIYTVLVGSAMQLAENNMLYAIVAIGFLLPAEKLLRSFFGFEKASTTGTIMGGAVGGAMTMAAINKIGKLKDIGSNKKENTEEDEDIRTSELNGDDLISRTFGGIGTGKDLEEEEEEKAPRTSELPGMNPKQQEKESKKQNNNPGEIQKKSKSNPDSKQQIIEQLKKQGLSDEEIANYFNGGKRTGIRQDDEGQKWMRQKPKRTTGQKIKGIGKMTGRYMRKSGGRLAKKGLGVVGKAYGGIALGAMGAIAGISTGDLSNVGKYAGTAGAVGYATGGALGDTITNGVTSIPNIARKLENDYIDEVYGNDATDLKNYKRDERFLRDREAREKYKLAFEDDRKVAIEEALKYRSNGITDDKMIIKEMKL